MSEGKELEGRLAIVAGASRGVGRRLAVRLAERGARVAVLARQSVKRPDNLGGLDETAALVAAAGSIAYPYAVDLADPAQVAQVGTALAADLGDADILCNVAARVDDPMYFPFDEMSVEEFRAQVELNLISYYALVKAAVPGMRRRGRGLVINFTSRAANHQEPGQAPVPGRGGSGIGYTASKAAVNRLTNHLANELFSDRIAVLALDPGSTTTENRLQVAARHGFAPEGTHDADLPARAATVIATSPDWMAYTGQVVWARDLAS